MKGLFPQLLMATSQNKHTIVLLRSVLSELRQALPAQHQLKSKPVVSSIMEQCRNYQLTQQKYCKGSREMEHLLQTYNTYLSSLRRSQEITATYKGKGERSISEAAAACGLQLPEQQSK